MCKCNDFPVIKKDRKGIFSEYIFHNRNTAAILYKELRLYDVKRERSGLFHRHLVYPSLMATALKIRGEEFVHDLTRHVRVDETPRHDQHIGIVVLTAQMGDFRNPAQACAYALVLVQRHADAFTAAADGYARIAFPVFYSLGQRMGIVA